VSATLTWLAPSSALRSDPERWEAGRPQVIHQQVAVGAGGKAIVAGTVKERRKAGGNRGGHE